MYHSNAQDAADDWGHARRDLLKREVVCFFKGCSVDLMSFEEVRKEENLDAFVERGLQTIALDDVRGSVGRYKDFSDAFLPRKDSLQERWESVDVAMREGKTPPIEVYQVRDTYFVVDGNHRVSVAKQRGLQTIDAYVTQFLTGEDVQDEASLDAALIASEKAAFLKSVGPENAGLARAMTLTCAGCYKSIMDQVEAYRQGYEAQWPFDLSYAEAFAKWHGEVYAPSVAAIRDQNMLADFPGRTEGDLFVWTWENNREL